jgi:acyl-CoA synthetase (AMP-forming)/AMP-acid ligase II
VTIHPSLETQILDAITGADADSFDALALKVFAYQYALNGPYRNFCDRRRLTPNRVDHWLQIPAVPTSGFKVADLTCRPDTPSTLFLTSGTTQGVDRRGRHLVADLTLAHAAILSNAQTSLFPDLPRSPYVPLSPHSSQHSSQHSHDRRLLILSLTPPPSQRPHSSLIHMIDLLMHRWGTVDSHYLGASDGLDGERLRHALEQAADDHQPIALFGTTAAFAQWFEECEGLNWCVAVPPGSRLMDTGGLKRAEKSDRPSSSAVTHVVSHRDAFLSLTKRLLGLPAQAIVNEYGMTELGSQFYSSSHGGSRDGSERLPMPPYNLLEMGACAAKTENGPPMPPYNLLEMGACAAKTENSPPMPPYPNSTGFYTIPPWMRVRVVDPATGNDMPPGKTGLLCHYDLANLHSVMAVHTDDLGVQPPGRVDGFYLLGRVAGSEPRGCSLDGSAALLTPR